MKPKRFAALCVLFASLMLSNVLRADPIIVFDHDGNVSGIRHLTIDGLLYNLTFEIGTFNSVYHGANQPTFLGDPAGAEDAEMTIGAWLDCRPFCGIAYLVTGPSQFFLVPFLHDDGTGLVTGLYECWEGGGGWHRHGECVPNAISFGPNNQAQIDDTVVSTYAVLRRIAVPEPATVALLGLGLASIAFARRRGR